MTTDGIVQASSRLGPLKAFKAGFGFSFGGFTHRLPVTDDR